MLSQMCIVCVFLSSFPLSQSIFMLAIRTHHSLPIQLALTQKLILNKFEYLLWNYSVRRLKSKYKVPIDLHKQSRLPIERVSHTHTHSGECHKLEFASSTQWMNMIIFIFLYNLLLLFLLSIDATFLLVQLLNQYVPNHFTYSFDDIMIVHPPTNKSMHKLNLCNIWPQPIAVQWILNANYFLIYYYRSGSIVQTLEKGSMMCLWWMLCWEGVGQLSNTCYE